ncbi:MAG: metallophosphoesterase [Syntrophaceae bacterium]|nr:metallophosphoesterase [Syntrophaceae bacterium]
MVFIIFRAIIFGIGLLCHLVDMGSRLFGSYARNPVNQTVRISIAVFTAMLYLLPFLIITVMPEIKWHLCLNILIFLLGFSAIVFFLFPFHFGIQSGRPSSAGNSPIDHTLTSAIILHEESLQIDFPVSFNNLQLLVLSDLHCNSQRQLEVIQEAINKLKADNFDLVLILGDLTENKQYIRLLFELFQELNAHYGKFLVRSNHDYEGGRFHLIEKVATESGVTLLNNTSFYIEKLDLTLIGTERPWCKTGVVTEISEFSIGLSHTPDNIKYLSRQKTSIVLAGHTHGGKIKIPLIGSILVPSIYGRFLDYGWFRYGKTLMFITQGFGYFPGIFNKKGEILKLNITSKPESA